MNDSTASVTEWPDKPVRWCIWHTIEDNTATVNPPLADAFMTFARDPEPTLNRHERRRDVALRRR